MGKCFGKLWHEVFCSVSENPMLGIACPTCPTSFKSPQSCSGCRIEWSILQKNTNLESSALTKHVQPWPRMTIGIFLLENVDADLNVELFSQRQLWWSWVFWKLNPGAILAPEKTAGSNGNLWGTANSHSSKHLWDSCVPQIDVDPPQRQLQLPGERLPLLFSFLLSQKGSRISRFFLVLFSNWLPIEKNTHLSILSYQRPCLRWWGLLMPLFPASRKTLSVLQHQQSLSQRRLQRWTQWLGLPQLLGIQSSKDQSDICISTL